MNHPRRSARRPAPRWRLALLLAGSLCAHAAAAPARHAAVLQANLPGESPELIQALLDELHAAGDTPATISLADLQQARPDAPPAFHLLVLPDGAHLPTSAAPAIERFARAGGHLIALQTPLWRDPRIHTDAGWIDRATWQRTHAGDPPPRALLAFEEHAVRDWIISRTPGVAHSAHETVPDGPGPNARSLHITGHPLVGFDSHYPRAIDQPFPPGHTLTLFSARGAPGTDQLMVEWEETDGSRWIATLDLDIHWRRFVLFPEDFKYWESIPARAASTFRPASARTLKFGVAASHTPNLVGRPFEFWVGPVGTAPDDENLAPLRTGTLPALDTLSPPYKLFDCRDVAQLATRDDQCLVSTARYDVPPVVRSPHPRARGAGFDKGRPWRWIPLIEARAADGAWRGTPATLTVHAEGPFKGGAWASIGLEGANWYLAPAARRTIRDLAAAMTQGLFLLDAGGDRFTCFPDHTLRLGVRAFSTGPPPAQALTARVTLTDRDAKTTVFQKTWPLAPAEGRITQVESPFAPPTWPAAGLECRAELLRQGRPVDTVEHEIHAARPAPDTGTVTAGPGGFLLDGRPWRAHGVNYMLTSGTAVEDYACFVNFLGPVAYDPEVVRRDLLRIRAIGLNAISTFLMHAATSSQNLLDLLRQADEIGLKVNLALLPTTPMDFQADKVREMIETHRLPDQPAVFAIDVDWEPMFGPQAHRARWDRLWAEWIVERYGSIEAAQRDWNCIIPRGPGGEITNPSAEQIDRDGPRRAMVAAYRRFLDTLLYQRYSAARRFIRAIDPRHLVSFRMSCAGDPTYRYQGKIPYDFPALAAAVDFLAPEGYGRAGGPEQVRPGAFTVAYARWAGAGRPVLWAEAGASTWDAARMQTAPAALDAQARFYENFYKMLIASRSDGIFWWYWPGGYRSDERSDFGLINPDGTDRPVTAVIRRHAAAFLEAPPPRTPDVWIEIDRDAHPDGLAGIYESAQQAFWRAVDAGRTPGLRTAGTGTTSADCPPLAVGNTPLTGSNPPKYLDAAFDRLTIPDPAGRQEPVDPGRPVAVRTDRPVLATIEITNLGEAAWLPGSPSRTGAVALVVQGPHPHAVPLPRRVDRHQTLRLEDVPLAPAGVDRPATVTIFLRAENRSAFGPRLAVTLSPQTPSSAPAAASRPE